MTVERFWEDVCPFEALRDHQKLGGFKVTVRIQIAGNDPNFHSVTKGMIS